MREVIETAVQRAVIAVNPHNKNAKHEREKKKSKASKALIFSGSK
jgi:hypothetical protein